MQVTLRGWGRDHGPKVLVNCELVYTDVRHGGGEYSWKETYFDLIQTVRNLFGRTRTNHTVCVTGSTELNLNGNYMVQVELNDREIDRLFYLIHGEKEGRETIKSLKAAAEALRGLYGEETGESAA